MSSDDFTGDPMLHLLKTLPASDVDRARADRTRLRCHRALERRQESPRRGVIEFAVIGVVCGAYLVEVLIRAMSLLG